MSVNTVDEMAGKTYRCWLGLVLFAPLELVVTTGARPSPFSISTLSWSSFSFRTRLPTLEPDRGLFGSATSARTPMGVRRSGSWFRIGLLWEGVLVSLRMGPALPTPLPMPMNILENSLLMPGSLAGVLSLAWAPCTA